MRALITSYKMDETTQIFILSLLHTEESWKFSQIGIWTFHVRHQEPYSLDLMTNMRLMFILFG